MTVLRRAGVAAVAITVALTASACEGALARTARKVAIEIAKEVVGPFGDLARDAVEKIATDTRTAALIDHEGDATPAVRLISGITCSAA